MDEDSNSQDCEPFFESDQEESTDGEFFLFPYKNHFKPLHLQT